jgi:hypothetical protein
LAGTYHKLQFVALAIYVRIGVEGWEQLIEIFIARLAEGNKIWGQVKQICNYTPDGAK